MARTDFASGVNIVLRGSFDPRILQPAWFAKQGLIADAEAETANVTVLHSQIALFETAGIRIQVTPDLFEATSLTQPFDEVVRDLVLGTFGTLKHMPVTAIGINPYCHLQTYSEEVWHSVGHYLVPKQFWRELVSDPGMQVLTIRGRRTDGYTGYIDVKVEPSVLAQPYGVFVQINDHVQVPDASRGQDASYIVEALRTVWPTALALSNQVFDAIDRLMSSEGADDQSN